MVVLIILFYLRVLKRREKLKEFFFPTKFLHFEIMIFCMFWLLLLIYRGPAFWSLVVQYPIIIQTTMQGRSRSTRVTSSIHIHVYHYLFILGEGRSIKGGGQRQLIPILGTFPLNFRSGNAWVSFFLYFRFCVGFLEKWFILLSHKHNHIPYWYWINYMNYIQSMGNKIRIFGILKDGFSDIEYNGIMHVFLLIQILY